MTLLLLVEIFYTLCLDCVLNYSTQIVFVCFVALRPKSTAMVMAGQSFT